MRSEKESRYLSLQAMLIGSVDFCQRLGASLRSSAPELQLLTANYLEAWAGILAHRPQMLVIEIGYQYSERTHSAMRRLLTQARERFGTDVYVVIALTAPEKFFFGGDLLFEEGIELNCSKLVDTFLAVPPGSIPSIPSLQEQALHALTLGGMEMVRRQDGKPPLPTLGEEGWAQSLVDPISRELWMRWLPRYASYTNENPLIIGATGTGKTNLAYALHRFSGRKGDFVSITPRDFSSSELVQAELFGAVAGAYTGAVDKWGLVKRAEKGTLFIDELQSIDKDLQGKIITFIENKAYRRVGSAESVDADVRFVFASNRTLDDMMGSDVLRHDFAYRLERVQLELFPLHQRRLDVAAALAFALAKVRRQRPQAQLVHGFNSSAYRLLFGHPWPGNLRQLENSVARLCELADMDEVSTVTELYVTQVLAAKMGGLATVSSDIISQAAAAVAVTAVRDSVGSLKGGVDKLVTAAREIALEACGGEIDRASALLGDDPGVLKLVAEAGAAARQEPKIS